MGRILAHSHSAMEQFETCPKQYWAHRVSKIVPYEESEHMAHGKAVHAAIEDYIIRDADFPLGMGHYEKQVKPFKDAPGKKYGEQKLAVDRSFQPCDWFDKETYFRAIIDLLILQGSNGVMVDWKTGRMKDGFDQLRLAAAILFANHKALQRIDLAYIWLREKEVTKTRVYREDVPEIWEEVIVKAKRIQMAYENDRFPAKPSGLCKKWCKVTECPHHGI